MVLRDDDDAVRVAEDKMPGSTTMPWMAIGSPISPGPSR